MKCFMEEVRPVKTGYVEESGREHISVAKEEDSVGKSTKTRQPLRSWLGGTEGLTLPGRQYAKRF